MRGFTAATSSSLCLALIALGFALLEAGPTYAQNRGEVDSSPQGRDSVRVADLESIRQDLLSTIGVLERMGSHRGLTTIRTLPLVAVAVLRITIL